VSTCIYVIGYRQFEIREKATYHDFNGSLLLLSVFVGFDQGLFLLFLLALEVVLGQVATLTEACRVVLAVRMLARGHFSSSLVWQGVYLFRAYLRGLLSQPFVSDVI